MPVADLAKISFEDALSELEKIVRGLESGTGDLKVSIDAYERGVALKKHCEAKLKEAQMKIEKISVSPDGKIDAAEGGKAKTEPFSAE